MKISFRPLLKLPLTESLDCGVLFTDTNEVGRYIYVATRYHWKSETYDSVDISLEHILSPHPILSENAGVTFSLELNRHLSPGLHHMCDSYADDPY